MRPSCSGGDNVAMSKLGIALCLTPLTLFVAFFVYGSWIQMTGNTPGMPNAVACIEGPNPAMSVEVTSNRRGSIDELNILGCTVYWYEGPRWGGD